MCTFKVGDGMKMPPSPSPQETPKKPVLPVETVAHSIDATAPRLIFLTGTSTAGKTSIMREFARSTPKSIELGTDDFAEARAVSLIKTHAKKEYAILSQAIEDKDLYRFIFSSPDFIKANPKLFFKSGSTSSQQAAVMSLNDSAEFFPKVTALLKAHKSTQDAEHFETILSHSDKGITVIFDTPNEKGLSEHLIKKPHHIRVERYLVYVSLFDLINRLPIRNAEALKAGNQPNQRQNIDLINQFMRTYRRANPDEPVVDVLSREEIQKIFAEKKEEIERENEGAKKNGHPTYAVGEDQFLEYFGLTSPGSKVPITTISDYRLFDGIFRTATQTSIVSAQKLQHTWKQL